MCLRAKSVAERRIPISAPDISGREEDYVLECVRSTWVSSKGAFIERFEGAFADFCGARYALSCNNGTSALHLALLALGIGPGDEVIVPTLTYVASANAVRYCGATPRFVDVTADTWNLDPADVARKIGPRTKAIMPVHLFGVPADMGPILELAKQHGLAVVEDAAEAHGALWQGRPAGSIGDIGTFSFYGNKIITTGEGGMVITGDPVLAERMQLLKGQGQDPQRPYWFPVVGFNYRMTNIQAALGLAQLETIERKLADRERVALKYRSLLGDAVIHQGCRADSRNANWMVAVLLRTGDSATRDAVSQLLATQGIETRPVFYPVHTMPPYAPDEPDMDGYPTAVDVAARGICLPTFGAIADNDIAYVCDRLMDALSRITA